MVRQTNDRKHYLKNNEYDYRSLHGQAPGFLSLTAVVLLCQPGQSRGPYLPVGIFTCIPFAGLPALYTTDAVLLEG